MADLQRASTPHGRFLRPSCARRAAALGVVLLFANACSDLGGPRKGVLSGFVGLQDSWAIRLGDFSGVEVALDGGSLRASTNPDGTWRIDKVPSGQHDIVFTKPGFGAVRIHGQIVSAPMTMVDDVIMALLPSRQAIIDSITMTSTTTPAGTRTFYLVDGHLSAAPPDNARAGAEVVFLGKTSAVSADTTSFERANVFTDPTGTLTVFRAVFSADEIHTAFGAGARVFATAYATATSCTCYPDPTKPSASKPLFSSIGPRGNVTEFTVP